MAVLICRANFFVLTLTKGTESMAGFMGFVHLVQIV